MDDDEVLKELLHEWFPEATESEVVAIEELFEMWMAAELEEE